MGKGGEERERGREREREREGEIKGEKWDSRRIILIILVSASWRSRKCALSGLSVYVHF